jgi:ABC-type amino acid transport substrate-binding protein
MNLLKTIALVCFAVITISCAVDQQIQTITPGVLTVAVTSGAPTNQYDSQLWIRKYVERFAAESELEISWVVVPFNESWLLASTDAVDLVATNVANFADRAHPGATFSAPFLYERRALRINPQDQARYAHINDFLDKTIGVVSGMAAERDVNSRAPDGVIVRTTNTFAELYAEFDLGQLDAIAEAEYYSLDGEIIASHGDDVMLIDHHDLTPGQREESVFVVSNNSQNLLSAVNAFVTHTKFPL